MLYWLTVMCSLGAATQGMDESVNNGANAIYPQELGFANRSIVYKGLAVSSPYLACATIGCWLNEPMNRYLGRRGTIFVSCFIAAAASIWEGFTYSWGQLFAARFVLGLGIGAKSSTMYVHHPNLSSSTCRIDAISQPCVLCRVCPSPNPWSAGDAVAGLDSFRNHAGKHNGGGIQPSEWNLKRHCVAADVRINCCVAYYRLFAGLLLSRESEMVDQKGQDPTSVSFISTDPKYGYPR